MTIPYRGVFLSQLCIRGEQKLTPSSHDVKEATFTCIGLGENLKGHYKPIDETYPEKLAKFTIAHSIDARMVYGERASEELPVYDSQEKLIGTLSVDIPGFSPIKNETLEELIEHNVMALLVLRWLRKDDDTHPGNISSAGTIDYDMFGYHCTYELKGGDRYVRVLQNSTARQAFPPLSERDARDMPLLHDAHPCFWPTQFPGNLNLAKDFSNRFQFIQLNGEPRAEKQKYEAYVQEMLLRHDTERFAQTAQSYFNNDDPFLAEDWYPYFKPELAENHALFTQMPEFLAFIKQNPECVIQCLSTEYPYFPGSNPKDYKNNVKHRFLKVWRDCCLDAFCGMAQKLSDIVKDFGATSQSASGIKPKTLRESMMVLKQVSARYQSESTNSDFYRQFCKNFSDQLLAFYEKETLTIEELENFLVGLGKSLLETTQKTENKISEPWNKTVNQLIEELKGMRIPEVIAQYYRGEFQPVQMSVLFPRKLDRTVYVPREIEISREEYIKKVADMLDEWVAGLAPAEFKKIIKEALDDYKPAGSGNPFGALNYRTYTSTRSAEIETLLNKNYQNSELFVRLTNHGGWKTNSYNTVFLKKLCAKLAQNYSVKMSQRMQLPTGSQDFRIMHLTFTLEEFEKLSIRISSKHSILTMSDPSVVPVTSAPSSSAAAAAQAIAGTFTSLAAMFGRR